MTVYVVNRDVQQAMCAQMARLLLVLLSPARSPCPSAAVAADSLFEQTYTHTTQFSPNSLRLLQLHNNHICISASTTLHLFARFYASE